MEKGRVRRSVLKKAGLDRAAHALYDAFDKDAKLAHRELQLAWPRRTLDPMRVGAGVSAITRTEYWRELGFSSLWRYLQSIAKPEELLGYGCAFDNREGCPDLMALLRQDSRYALKVSLLRDVVTPLNISRWIGPLMTLSYKELRQMVRAYKQSKAGHVGERLVYIPLFVPASFYEQEWAPRREPGKPPWFVLKEILSDKEGA